MEKLEQQETTEDMEYLYQQETASARTVEDIMEYWDLQETAAAARDMECLDKWETADAAEEMELDSPWETAASTTSHFKKRKTRTALLYR